MLKDFYMQIEPMDTLFFRENKAFQMKMSHFIPSLLQPYPSTMYGAIFSGLVREGCYQSSVKDLKGITELQKAFRIKNRWLYHNWERYIKAPLDLYYHQNSIRLGTYDEIPDSEMWGCYSPRTGDKKYQRAENHYISFYDFYEYYVADYTDAIQLIPESKIFARSNKLGIQINKATHTAEDEYLYQIEEVSFKDPSWSYIVQGKTNEDKVNTVRQKMLIKLGGESRMASMRSLGNIQHLEKYVDKEQKIKHDCIKWILCSPMFKTDYNEFIKSLEDKGCQVIGEVTGHPQFIGGYDMAEKKQRMLERALPAGSLLIIQGQAFKEKSIQEVEAMIDPWVEELSHTYRGFNQFVIAPFRKDRGH